MSQEILLTGLVVDDQLSARRRYRPEPTVERTGRVIPGGSTAMKLSREQVI